MLPQFRPSRQELDDDRWRYSLAERPHWARSMRAAARLAVTDDPPTVLHRFPPFTAVFAPADPAENRIPSKTYERHRFPLGKKR